jgi:hypothetical protein
VPRGGAAGAAGAAAGGAAGAAAGGTTAAAYGGADSDATMAAPGAPAMTTTASARRLTPECAEAASFLLATATGRSIEPSPFTSGPHFTVAAPNAGDRGDAVAAATTTTTEMETSSLSTTTTTARPRRSVLRLDELCGGDGAVYASVLDSCAAHLRGLAGRCPSQAAALREAVDEALLPFGGDTGADGPVRTAFDAARLLAPQDALLLRTVGSAGRRGRPYASALLAGMQMAADEDLRARGGGGGGGGGGLGAAEGSGHGGVQQQHHHHNAPTPDGPRARMQLQVLARTAVRDGPVLRLLLSDAAEALTATTTTTGEAGAHASVHADVAAGGQAASRIALLVQEVLAALTAAATSSWSVVDDDGRRGGPGGAGEGGTNSSLHALLARLTDAADARAARLATEGVSCARAAAEVAALATASRRALAMVKGG